MSDKKRVAFKQFRYNARNKPLTEAAKFASTLGENLITITGHGDMYTSFIDSGGSGQVVVWYYEE